MVKGQFSDSKYLQHLSDKVPDRLSTIIKVVIYLFSSDIKPTFD